MHVLTGPTDKQLRKVKKQHDHERKVAEKPGTPTLSWEQVQGVDAHQYLRNRISGTRPINKKYRDGYDNINWGG